ncbi:MAG TPA: glucosamine-6-phosphate deaminase [Clostridiales bacterium]|nr:glucosamine-6-phosphate deaminase [Clostridiales bacterium]
MQTSFTVRSFQNRAEMGRAAAADTAACINRLLQEKEHLSMIFAAAPSQNEFLEALRSDRSIDFRRITAFHMDEYVGLDPQAPQGFGNFLRDRLFSQTNFRQVHYLNGNAADPQAECFRYAQLLRENPPDIVCLGIGENGHIAFNDPHVADFHDPQAVRCVTLDKVCRTQQVHDGCFASLELVPEQALTLTIPTLINARFHFCIVPGPTKAQAVSNTVAGPIDPSCPASSLRLCENAVLYLDEQSAALLPRR